MKKTKRKIRQEKLAKIFYEMGMELDLVSKMSGVKKEEIVKFKKNSR